MKSSDLIDLVENSILSKLSEIHTITIAKITKVNSKTIDVKPVFKRKIIQNGETKEIEYPIFIDVPPIFLNGGSNYISFPLAVGDDVLLLINERCFDNWYEGLDNKVPLEYRMFDYSDAFCLVGIQPKASAITIPSDGRTHQIGNTYQVGNYERLGSMTMTGDFTLHGNLTVNGNVTINSGDLTVDGISFKNHVHPQNDGNDAGGGVNTGVAQ